MEGRFTDASNATLLGTTETGERVIYKPSRGERPLWDFPPDTLAAREVLTYEVSEAMGLGVVPETVFGTGSFGPGAVQRFVEAKPGFDVLVAVRSRDPRLWALAVLDVVCNNADRKLGHIIETGGRLVGIDHGLTFHPEDKLRTVLWVFAAQPVPSPLLDRVGVLGDDVAAKLGNRVEMLLGADARAALAARVDTLLAQRHHPVPPDDRPPVPWPPY